MTDFKVRPAILLDIEKLLEFEQGIIEAERPMDPTIRKGHINYYDLKELIKSEDAEVVVVECNNMIVSSGYALKKLARHYLDHEYYAYLGFMFTVPEYRGQGINALVIDYLKKWAISKGLTEIRLTVYDDNPVAIRAYEKIGFKKHIIEMRIK